MTSAERFEAWWKEDDEAEKYIGLIGYVLAPKHAAHAAWDAQQKEIDRLEAALRESQEALARWIVPDSGISDKDVLNELLGILDNKELVRALKEDKPL